MRVTCEMNERAWDLFRSALVDLPDEEIHWRPLPEANSINAIIRHLRIEAEWHLASLQRGSPMPTVATAVIQQEIDAVPLDFDENRKVLEDSVVRFLETLRAMTIEDLVQRSSLAYGAAIDRDNHAYFLAYHQAIHLSMHCGQIRSIRNLYCKTRGEPARFFPDNPTYPK